MALSGGATHLLDKSASARAKFSVVSDRLVSMFERGQLATCSIIDLEVLFSARSRAEYATVRLDRATVYERIDIAQQDFDRAIEIQSILAERNRHRQISIPDLLIAAVAEKASLTVLHYDADFDLLADVSGASTEWVVPKGSL